MSDVSKGTHVRDKPLNCSSNHVNDQVECNGITAAGVDNTGETVAEGGQAVLHTSQNVVDLNNQSNPDLLNNIKATI